MNENQVKIQTFVEFPKERHCKVNPCSLHCLHTKILSNLSAVLATEPNRFIIFKEPIPDKVLPDHVIRTEKVANEGSCRVKCYLEPNCVSLNVGPADEGGRTCELNNATDESPTKSNLKERQHYIHYAIEVCMLLYILLK